MTFEKKLATILLWPLLALGAIWHGRALLGQFSPELMDQVKFDQQMMVAIVALYAVNYLVAWHFASSWPLFVVRALLFALLAFVCFDKLVYLAGEDPDRAMAVFRPESSADPAKTAVLRVQLFYWVLGLAHSITAIALGFEKPRRDS